MNGVLHQTGFCRTLTRTVDGGAFSATVELNPEHPIFRGHFPGRPITPGVCSLELTREVVGAVTGRSWLIRSCQSVKFSRLIEPGITPIVRVAGTLSYRDETSLSVSATVQTDEGIACKISGLFEPTDA